MPEPLFAPSVVVPAGDHGSRSLPASDAILITKRDTKLRRKVFPATAEQHRMLSRAPKGDHRLKHALLLPRLRRGRLKVAESRALPRGLHVPYHVAARFVAVYYAEDLARSSSAETDSPFSVTTVSSRSSISS